jgi:hypothetical protein
MMEQYLQYAWDLQHSWVGPSLLALVLACYCFIAFRRIATLRTTLATYQARVADLAANCRACEAANFALVNAIRRHRDAEGHDRCWLSDVELYESIGGAREANLQLPELCEFMGHCAAYWNSRQPPADQRIDPSQLKGKVGCRS